MAEISECLQKAEYLAGHNVAGDVTELVEAGLPVKEEWVRGDKALDSLLLSRMQDENDLSYELENLALANFDIEPWKDKTRAFDRLKITDPETGRKKWIKDVDARRWPVELRRDRCARDAWAARLLVEKFYDKTKADLIRYTHRTAMTLERVNIAGAIIDLDVLKKLDTEYRLVRDEARDKLVKLAAAAGVEGFSPTNDNHIRELLFERLGLEPLGKTPGGLASVDKNVLKQLGDNDAARLLLSYNRADKLYTVNVSGVWSASRTLVDVAGGALQEDGLRPGPYVEVLPSSADSVHIRQSGRVLGADRAPAARAYLPFRINPLGARTGRRSSSKPNAQNWPEAVRGLVTSRWQDGLILNADYKKLEVVLIAWVAGDAKLLEYFLKGRGYIDVAKELFGYEVDSSTPMYTAVKSIVLGVHYNMQTPKMAKNLWTLYDEKKKAYPCRLSADYDEHTKEVDRLRKLYLRRFSGIGRYMQRREERWLKLGYSDSFTGRVRHLPVPDRNERGYGHMLNQAINFPIQSLASDVTASAMMDIEAEFMAELGVGYVEYLQLLIEQRRKLLTRGLDRGIMIPVSQIFNEVHDSLVVDLHPDRVKRHSEIVVECMRAVKSLKQLAPGFDTSILDADVKIHHHWKSK